MIKLPIIAALVTVLSHHLHALTPSPPSVPSNPSIRECTATTTSPSPTPDAMREYMRILRTLGTLAQLSGELEIQRARELGMMLYTKVETMLRVRWLHELADKGELGATAEVGT